MADLNALVESLSELTVLEAAELSKLLEEKWGVSAAAAVAAPAAGGGAAAPAAEEQTEFDVILTGDGGKKINVIKEVRARPDRSQDAGRVGSQGRQGRRVEGRGSQDQGSARSSWRDRRGQVSRSGRDGPFWSALPQGRPAVPAPTDEAGALPLLAAAKKKGGPSNGVALFRCAPRRFHIPGKARATLGTAPLTTDVSLGPRPPPGWGESAVRQLGF
jgi:hypothetical protein